MPVRNQNWYNLQEGRRYPLDDRSTGIDDAGAPIADNIIVDCHIRFPNTLGTFAFVSAITVSGTLVTVLISAADDEEDPATFQPIAAVSLAKPIETGVNQPLQALVPGVAGWVAFGSGIQTNFSGRYSTPIQTLISPRCARPYRPLPIPTMGKLNLNTALTGLVKLLARPPVTATYEEVEVNETTVPAIVFRLMGDFGGTNPLKDYGGPCSGRPESGTCAKLGLQNINGIKPDCDGNISIRSNDFMILPILDEDGSCAGGIDILTEQGLADACNDAVKRRRRRARDLCESSMSSMSEDELPPWENPIDKIPQPPDIVSSISLGDPDFFGSCYPEESCFDFAGADASAFMTTQGLFAFSLIEPPIDDCNEVSAAPRYAYTAASTVDLNTSILRNCAGDISEPHTVSAVLRLDFGIRRNGGIIINYTPPGFENNTNPRFVGVSLDMDAGVLKVCRYNGTSVITEGQADFNALPDVWYRVSATFEEGVGGVLVSASVESLNGPETAGLVTTVSQFGIPTGVVGVFSDRAYTPFASFTFGE